MILHRSSPTPESPSTSVVDGAECSMEQQWIGQLQQRCAPADLRHDTYWEPGSDRLMSTDMLVEGVHFDLAYMTLADVGWKLVAVNASDMAATGGEPTWLMVSISAPKNSQLMSQLNTLWEGIDQACQVYGCQVIGGDTVAGAHWVVNGAMGGKVAASSAVARRHVAQPGDVVISCGYHGPSAAGLWLLQNNDPGYEALKALHRRPSPPVSQGQALAQQVDRLAMMDTSDGLADALSQLAAYSEVDLIVHAEAIPLHPEFKQLINDPASLEKIALFDPWSAWVLDGGEDFALVACLDPHAWQELQAHGLVSDWTLIGHVHAKADDIGQATCLSESAPPRRLTVGGGYHHFALEPFVAKERGGGPIEIA